MTINFVDYETAVRTKNRNGQWLKAHDRLKPEAWPAVIPTFSIEPGASIFTIGSCFARNIETHMHRLGYKLPTLDFRVPDTEWTGRAAELLNKYTPASIGQEIAWAADLYRRGATPSEADCAKFAYTLEDGTVIDNNLAKFSPVSPERFLERRREIYNIVKTVFTADCVVITPGVAEAWYDAEREIYIQEVITFRAPNITKNLKFGMLDYETCFNYLDRAVTEIREINPNAKFLITTSPIPLARTFTQQDILISNTYAKSMLRAACGALVDKWENVDYFPSFESVMLTRDWKMFEGDLIHVTDAFIAKVVARLAESYCEGLDAGEQLFQKALETEDQQAAIAHLREAISASPDVADYHSRLGGLLSFTDNLKEAEAELRLAAELDPVRFPLGHKLLEISNGYARKGNLETALKYLEEATTLDKQLVYVHHRIGVLRLRLNDLAGAEAAYRKSIEFNPTGIVQYFKLADLLRRQKRAREAIEVLEKGLLYGPQDPSLNMQLGLCYRATGDLEAAARQFEQVLEVMPDHPNAQRQLAATRKLAAAKAAA